jgi:hypothetical protein
VHRAAQLDHPGLDGPGGGKQRMGGGGGLGHAGQYRRITPMRQSSAASRTARTSG